MTKNLNAICQDLIIVGRYINAVPSLADVKLIDDICDFVNLVKQKAWNKYEVHRKSSNCDNHFIYDTGKFIEPPHDKTNKMTCAPSEDSDQPGHSPSLIRVFAVRMKKPLVISFLLSAQRRL